MKLPSKKKIKEAFDTMQKVYAFELNKSGMSVIPYCFIKCGSEQIIYSWGIYSEKIMNKIKGETK